MTSPLSNGQVGKVSTHDGWKTLLHVIAMVCLASACVGLAIWLGSALS